MSPLKSGDSASSMCLISSIKAEVKRKNIPSGWTNVRKEGSFALAYPLSPIRVGRRR
jgi:hypothetical protein